MKTNMTFFRYPRRIILWLCALCLISAGLYSPRIEQVYSTQTPQESFQRSYNMLKDQLVFSTLYQPKGFDNPICDTIPSDILVDQKGNAYWIGFSDPVIYPTHSFLIKVSPEGKFLFELILEASFRKIQEDPQGNLWIAGRMGENKLQSLHPWSTAANSDAFLMQVSPEGGVLRITPWVGDGKINNFKIQGDRMYFIGATNSSNYPQTQQTGDIEVEQDNGFFTVTDLEGRILFSTVLGGNHRTYLDNMEVGQDGSIFFGGSTYATNLPVKNAFQAIHSIQSSDSGTKRSDIFVGKWASDYSLVFLSYLGGKESDYLDQMALNSRQELYLTGNTESEDFPLKNTINTKTSGKNLSNTYLCILNSNGELSSSSLLLDGSSLWWSMSFDAVDQLSISGDKYIANQNSFVSYDLDGSHGLYIFLPGMEAYFSLNLPVRMLKHYSPKHRPSEVWIMGATRSASSIPLVNAHQSEMKGFDDAYLMKLQLPPSLAKPNKLLLHIGQEKATFMETGKVTLLPPLEAPPMIVQGRTLIPVRVLAETMGMEVSWVSAGQYIWLDRDGVRLELQIGRNFAWKYALDAPEKRVKLEMDVPPMIVNNRTLLPLRFVTENFGALVDWNPREQKILVSW